MTYENALEKIHSLLTFGSRPGLDRIKRLLALMGNPQDSLKFIHIAGTNGKGSACRFLSSVLTCQGYKTGLFISPYITDFRERIQINGEIISQEALTNAVESTFPLIEKLKGEDCIITEFEYVMALEFYIHAKADCDIVVLETGMGGLLDCTNVIKPPLCSVITAIGIDHTAVLGNTIEEIALQKCGIIKGGSIAVTSPQEKSVINIIEKNAAEKGVPLYKAGSADIIQWDMKKTVFLFNGKKIEISLLGQHQVENACTVLTALEVLRLRGLIEISEESILKGMKAAENPARLEVLSQSPAVILDGAHNPNGIEALKKSLDLYLKGREKICIIGMLKDKDSLSSVRLLEGEFREVITVPVNNPRSLDEKELADICRGYFQKVTAERSVFSAFDYAYEKAKTENHALIICGSLYLAGEIRPYALKKLAEK